MSGVGLAVNQASTSLKSQPVNNPSGTAESSEETAFQEALKMEAGKNDLRRPLNNKKLSGDKPKLEESPDMDGKGMLQLASLQNGDFYSLMQSQALLPFLLNVQDIGKGVGWQTVAFAGTGEVETVVSNILSNRASSVGQLNVAVAENPQVTSIPWDKGTANLMGAVVVSGQEPVKMAENTANRAVWLDGRESSGTGMDAAANYTEPSQTNRSFQSTAQMTTQQQKVSEGPEPVIESGQEWLRQNQAGLELDLQTNQIFDGVETIHVKVGDIPVRMDTATAYEDLSNRIILRNENEFDLQLSPVELGKIRIKVVFEDGETNVSVLCSNRKAMEMILGGSDKLTALLENHTGSHVNINVEQGESDKYYPEDGRSGNGGGQENNDKNNQKNKKQSGMDFLEQMRLGLI